MSKEASENPMRVLKVVKAHVECFVLVKLVTDPFALRRSLQQTERRIQSHQKVSEVGEETGRISR